MLKICSWNHTAGTFANQVMDNTTAGGGIDYSDSEDDNPQQQHQQNMIETRYTLNNSSTNKDLQKKCHTIKTKLESQLQHNEQQIKRSHDKISNYNESLQRDMRKSIESKKLCENFENDLSQSYQSINDKLRQIKEIKRRMRELKSQVKTEQFNIIKQQKNLTSAQTSHAKNQQKVTQSHQSAVNMKEIESKIRKNAINNNKYIEIELDGLFAHYVIVKERLEVIIGKALNNKQSYSHHSTKTAPNGMLYFAFCDI